MRTHTLFAVALASFLVHFSDAAAVGPVNGVLANVVPEGTGNLGGTAAGQVASASGPSPDRKIKKRFGRLGGLSVIGNLLGNDEQAAVTSGKGSLAQDPQDERDSSGRFK